MAKLVYSAICSLDGYTVDASGKFDWAAPDKELHSFVNEQERGRRDLPLRQPHVRGHALLADRVRR